MATIAQVYEHGLRIRRRLTTATPIQALRARALRGRRLAWAAEATADAGQNGVLETLVGEGACERAPAAFDALLPPDTRDLLAGLPERLTDARLWAGGAFVESEALLAFDPRLYRLGLAAPLLDIAERYIGLPCWYLGALLKRETPDGVARGPRQWHRDIEDDRMLRVLVYLSEVGDGDGPFEYLPAGPSDTAARMLNYRLGYLPAEALAAAAPVPPREARGGPGHAVFFDGARIFHRAQPPRRRTRYSLTLTYVSRWPLQLNPTAQLPPAARRRVLEELGPRERACLPPARRLPLAPR